MFARECQGTSCTGNCKADSRSGIIILLVLFVVDRLFVLDGVLLENADKNNVRKIARPFIKNIGMRLQFHQDGTECSSR